MPCFPNDNRALLRTSREKGEITRLSGDNGMPSRHSSRYCIIHSGSFRHSFQSQGHAVMTLSNLYA